MRPFRILSIRRSLFGGWYIRYGRKRRLVHIGGRLWRMGAASRVEG